MNVSKSVDIDSPKTIGYDFIFKLKEAIERIFNESYPDISTNISISIDVGGYYRKLDPSNLANEISLEDTVNYMDFQAFGSISNSPLLRCLIYTKANYPDDLFRLYVSGKTRIQVDNVICKISRFVNDYISSRSRGYSASPPIPVTLLDNVNVVTTKSITEIDREENASKADRIFNKKMVVVGGIFTIVGAIIGAILTRLFA